MRIQTHYDNLRIPRDAPPEIVGTAYWVLKRGWQKARDEGNPDAGQVLRLVEAAFRVLSDPEERVRHDAWIVARENESPEGLATVPPAAQEPEAVPPAAQEPEAVPPAAQEP
ncbi:MAG: hypothetical protein V4505_10525, partial [Pseudomonadota bacterium]